MKSIPEGEGETLQDTLQTARRVAAEAAMAAGRLARERFFGGWTRREKGNRGDWVTDVDLKADHLIVDRIRQHFPDHQVRSEEQGTVGPESDWLWYVDPLDGTNNYAMGLPVYGVSITLLHRRQPVLGVIYDSPLDRLYIAEKGKGAQCGEASLQLNKGDSLAKMTVGWIQGHQVGNDPAAGILRQLMDRKFKRVLRLWAPSLLWCMLARGDLDGIILYNSEGEDLYAGLLMAKEAGAAVVDYQGNPFTVMNPEPYLIACHPDYMEEFLALVSEGREGDAGDVCTEGEG